MPEHRRTSFAAKPENASERIGLRDPTEPSEGPLRLDDGNYSTERLTLPEGNDNVYADDEASYLDEEPTAQPEPRKPPYAESSERELLQSLPQLAPDAAPGAAISERDEAGGRRQSGDGANHDLAILDVVNDVLSGLPESDAGSVDVDVQDCVVVLSGSVGETATHTRIEQAVEAIPGVMEIRNCLTIRGEGPYPRWSDT